MARVSNPQYNFTAGEFSPKLYGRADIAKYSNGARIVENLITTVEGGVERRPGTYFINEVANSNFKTRLIPFEFSTEQAYILEFGNEYIRFYKNYERIEVSGIPYELTNSPYQTADLFDIKYIQDSDVMYLTHPDYYPRKLSRTGTVSGSDYVWTLELVDFIDGPYLDENDTDTTITPSEKTGSITLAASADLFDPYHVGSFWRIKEDTLLQDGSASTGSDETLDDTWTAIKFTALGNYILKFLAIKFKVSAPLSNEAEIIQAYLYGDNAGVPGTPITGGDEIRYGDLTTSYVMHKFQLETTLVGGTVYWIVLRRGAAPSGGTIKIDKVASGTAQHAISADGASWTPENTKTGWFKLYGDSSWGYVQITYVTNPTTATANVIEDLTGIDPVKEWREGAFSDYQGYPSCLAFHEQRMLLAGVPNNPQTIYASWVGAYQDFTPGTTEDDAPYTHVIAAERVNAIRWMTPSTNLIIGTSGGVWRVGSQDASAPITQSNVKAVPVPE